MILTEILAALLCDAKGCTNSVSGKLALMPGGGFGFKPNVEKGGHNWLINMHPVGGFASYCPLHVDKAPKIQAAPNNNKLVGLQ